MADLFSLFDTGTVVAKPAAKKAQTSSKKTQANLADNIVVKSLYEFDDIVEKTKISYQDLTEDDTIKLLKSKKLSLAERLSIINERVLKVLGKQKNNIIVIKDRETFHSYITDCINTGRIDIDTETNNSLDPVTCKLMGLCLYAPGLKQAYIPINHRNPETKERLSWQLTEQDVAEELQRLLDAKTFIVMHNGKFDYEVICCTCAIRIRPDWDTMIAARLLNENEHASLKELYIKYVDKSQEKYKIDKLFAGVQYADVDPEIFALYAATDAMMTDKIFELQEPKMLQADKDATERKKVNPGAPNGLYWVFKHIEMPIVIVTAEMEMRGVAIDTDFGKKLKDKYDAELGRLDAEVANELAKLSETIMKWKLTKEANERVKIYAAKKTKMSKEKLEATYNQVDEHGKRFKYGKAKIDILEDPINLGSPAQLAVLFYDILKCEAVNKDKVRGAGKDELEKLGSALEKYSEEKSKALDLSEEELEETFENLSADEDTYVDSEDSDVLSEDVQDLFVHKTAAKLCSLLLDRRKLVKLVSTYIDVIPELTKHWPDGRIRFHLNSLGTDTGRYSSGGKLKFMENEEAVEVSGINIQNIPSHNKEVRMLFRGSAKYHKVEEENNCFTIPETDEVETAEGWKLVTDLTIGDFILIDGEAAKIANISKEDKAYLVRI